MSSVAADAALNTYELLEHILHQLYALDLSRARCVSNRWRDIIARSSTCRRSLFLDAAPLVRQTEWRVIQAGTNGRLDLLRAHLVYKRYAPTHYTVATLHPALRFGKPHSGIADMTFQVDLNDLLRWKPGDWETMHVTQPPCYWILLKFWWASQSASVSTSFKGNVGICQYNGIRLGDIRNAILDESRRVGTKFYRRVLEVTVPNRVTDAGLWVREAGKNTHGHGPCSIGSLDEAERGYKTLENGDEEWLDVKKFDGRRGAGSVV